MASTIPDPGKPVGLRIWGGQIGHHARWYCGVGVYTKLSRVMEWRLHDTLRQILHRAVATMVRGRRGRRPNASSVEKQ